jgi:hypothetical protein
MANIEGLLYTAFNDGGNFYASLYIGTVSFSIFSPFGTLGNSSLGDANKNPYPINGTYNPTTNEINFNDAKFQGEFLYVKFYTGYVMVDASGVTSMAGTWNEAVLKVPEDRRHSFSVRYDSGAWTAMNPEIISFASEPKVISERVSRRDAFGQTSKSRTSVVADHRPDGRHGAARTGPAKAGGPKVRFDPSRKP